MTDTAQQPLGYVDYDYAGLVQSLNQRLALQPAWKDTYESATGQMLIELFAAVGTLVLYYVERRAEESYIDTAQNISSVINLVRLIGYTPRRNVSSVGSLEFTAASVPASIIDIPKYTSVSSTNGYNFVTSNSASIIPPATSQTTTGIQGVVQNISYTSAGGANQTYNIDDTKIENSNVAELVASNLTLSSAQNMVNYFTDNDQSAYLYGLASGLYNVYTYPSSHPITLTVSVDGVEWVQVSSFVNSINTSQHYVLRTELDQTVSIIFGNGSFGMTPSIGSIIAVTYIQSDGVDGNAYSLDVITNMDTTLYDQSGAAQEITVTNTTTFLGGDDAETIDEIRTTAPNVFATGQRCVTKADFAAIIKAFPGVADAIVFGENDRNPPNYDMFNQVQICAILQNWELPNADFQQSLTDYLYLKSLITVRYSYITPTIINAVPTLKVVLTPGSSVTYVTSLVDAAVQGQFVLGVTTFLGRSIYHSDVIRVIEETAGVDHCYVQLKIQKELIGGAVAPYDYAAYMDLLPAVSSKVELYIDNTQIAVDDNAGGWTNLGGTYTVTGIVDYSATGATAGLVGANISPAPPGGSSIYMRYQQDEDGDLVTSESQICKWYQTVYTSIG